VKSKNALLIVGIVGAFIVLAALGFVALTVGNARSTRSNLLTQYFRALSTQNAELIEDLTTADFGSDLPIDGLSPKAYRLYSFSEASDDELQRFALVITKADGAELIYLADIAYETKGLKTSISAIRLVQKGSRLKE
jgi:hypothetical protein